MSTHPTSGYGVRGMHDDREVIVLAIKPRPENADSMVDMTPEHSGVMPERPTRRSEPPRPSETLAERLSRGASIPLVRDFAPTRTVEDHDAPGRHSVSPELALVDPELCGAGAPGASRRSLARARRAWLEHACGDPGLRTADGRRSRRARLGSAARAARAAAGAGRGRRRRDCRRSGRFSSCRHRSRHALHRWSSRHPRQRRRRSFPTTSTCRPRG